MTRTVMTFKEFQDSQKRETKADFEERTRTDTMDEDATHVLSYGPYNYLYILEYPDSHDFPYSLLLERDYWDGYDLEQLERRLYDWALQNECVDVEVEGGS